MPRYDPERGWVDDEEEQPQRRGGTARRPVSPEQARVPWWQRPLREIDRSLQAVAEAVQGAWPVLTGQRLPGFLQEGLESAAERREVPVEALRAQQQAAVESVAGTQGAIGDALALPLRPTSALAAPLLEAARRLRTGEPLGDFDYGREMGRQFGHGLPGVGEPRVDLFRTGTEIVAGREGDPTRWPALLGGVGAELLPIAPYLAVGFGTASTRTVRGSWARAASAAGQRAAAETGSAEVGATVTSRFRSVVDEFLPGRRSAAQYFKQARTGRAQVTPSEIALGEDALTERIAPRLYEEAEAAGLSPRVAGRVVDQFLADVQWEAQPHWRVEWPGGARPLAEWQRPSRVAGRGPTPVLQPGMKLAPSREIIDVYGLGESAYRMQGELELAARRIDPLDIRAWQAGAPPAPRMIRRMDAAVRAADPALTTEQVQKIVRGWLRESRGGIHGVTAIGYPFVEAEVGVLQGDLRFQARPQAGTTMTYRYYQPRARRLPGQMRAVGEKRAWAPVESAVEVEARLAHERELGRLRREIAEIDELLRTVRPAARFAAPAAPTTAAPTGVPEWARRPLVAPEYEPSARGALAPEGAQTAQPTPETGVSSQIQAAPESPGVPATQRPGEAPADLVQEEARFPIDLSGAERDENGDYILYHGTTRDRAEHILRYGLYGDPRYGPALTALPSQAGTFAQQRYELSGFVGEPVILRVRVPAAEAGNFRENVDPRSLGYSGPVIPPEWVVDVVPAKERWRLDDAYRAWSERQAAPAPRPVQTTIEGEAAAEPGVSVAAPQPERSAPAAPPGEQAPAVRSVADALADAYPEPLRADQIHDATGLPIEQVMADVTMLQLAGTVTRDRYARFSLTREPEGAEARRAEIAAREAQTAEQREAVVQQTLATAAQTPEQQAIVEAIAQAGGSASVDDLTERTGLQAHQVSTNLMLMEVAGQVRRLPGNVYEVVASEPAPEVPGGAEVPATPPVQTTIEGEAERVAPERSTLEERQGRPMARGRPQQIGFDAFAEETPQTTLADFTGEAQQMVGREGFGVSRDTAPAAPAEEDAFAAAAELTPEEAARHAEELEAPEVAGGAEVPATPKPAIPAPTPLAAPPPIPIQAARPLVDEATAMRAERRAARALNARLRELAKELRREHRLAPKGSGTRMQLRAMLTEVGKAIKPQSERTALGRAARAAEAKARRAHIRRSREAVQAWKMRTGSGDYPANIDISPWMGSVRDLYEDYRAYVAAPQAHKSPFMEGYTEAEQEGWWEVAPTILNEAGWSDPSGRYERGSRRVSSGMMTPEEVDVYDYEVAQFERSVAAREEEALLRSLQYEVDAVEEQARALAEGVYEEMLAQGLAEEQAREIADETAGGLRLLNEEVYERLEAMERVAAARATAEEERAAAARRAKYTHAPPTLERQAQINALRRDVIARAEAMLGVEPAAAPELAPPRYDIAAAVADAVADAAGAFAERTRSQREALRQQLLATARPRPGESPLQTATRTIIEGYGVAYTPQLAGLAENVERAGLERLRAAKAKQLADLEAAGPDTAAFTAYHREAGIRSEEARAARSLRARAGQVIRWFVKWPGVLIEHRRTLELCQTEVDALTARLLRYGEQVFGGRYRGGRLHPTTANERRVVTWLLTVRALGASPADELTVVLESLRPHVGEQKLGQPEDYLTSTGTIAMSKLPPVARRVFEIAAELRKLYDEMRDGSDAVGPGFVEMKLALGLPPGTLEDYVPQPPILPFGPEDYEIVGQLALRELLLGREEAERFAREQYGRPDITEHRTWADRTAALQAFLESARRGEPEQRALKEPDAEACYRWYVHRFAALRTAYLVQQWLKDHAYTELDYRLDPNVGNTGVNEMYETGWGPPNPWGHTPESMEGYLLPPPLRAAVNEVLSSGTAPALFDQMFRTWVRPWMKYLRPWQVAPLETVRFLGTQLWELGTNMVFLTSRAGPRQLWEGLLMANQMLSRDLLAIMERYPPTSWAQASQAQCATARANLAALATRRWGVTVADVDALLAKAERANLLSGAVGSQAKEEVETIVTGWTGVAEDEARALVDAGTGLIMNWDRLCRTWAFCTLLLEGYSETEAAAAVREWTVSYDRAARRPWHEGASYFLFYWRWAAERTEQYASLAYKRPGVLLALAQLDEEDRERYLGLSPGQAALAGGRPPWMATQLDIAAVRWDCPITRNIKRHLEECKYLEAWDGYYMPYVRFAVPLLDWLGTAQEAMAKPHEYFAEQLMPVGRGLVEAERGRPLREIQKGIPLVGPWVRAADKFPTEVWDEIELQIGPIDLGHDVPLEAFERVAEAGRTPEYCRTPRRWQGRPKAQRVRYEAEKMRLYFLIERATRSSGAAIYVQTVPQALDNMTTGQCAAAIAAIDAGEDLRRWPGDRPARFRAALEKEIEQREAGVTHEFDANPRTRGEQIGGIPGWVSRQLRPEKELLGR